jgi:hypothetical protein
MFPFAASYALNGQRVQDKLIKKFFFLEEKKRTTSICCR